MTTTRTASITTLLGAAALLALGCAGAPVQEEPSAAEAAPVEEGARIWSTACNRCHNLRPPTEFASEQWPVIVSHMRTRADLTKSEADAVTAFLRRQAEARGS